eukprot:CAMPEP_0119003798 /NCGR_PEP_ID=MMETSP1176-20130426/771_1 /TAXON_ID=265551 /ORGANISM="Synedropsis recta cf, Strain CCMP1620" /LENGTH=240 /DNA_ID=CAMNT_0006955429 /DNA_START=111 /DNA_END=833 /DNA_ORIENTATION=+
MTTSLCALGVLRASLAFSTAPSSSAASRSSTLMVAAVRSSAFSSSSALFSSKEEVDPGKVDGTDLRILKYPHPSLRAANAEVTAAELEDGTITKIAKEMLLVMYAAEGIGLAAPQVGINKQVMVYNESGDSKKWLDEVVLVNPKIVEFSEGRDVEMEGCLSFPDMNGDVERSKWIKVEALTTKGRKVKKKYKGWEARVFQHEYDHLEGKVYIDHLDEENLGQVKPTLDQLIEEFGEGGEL